MEHTRPDNQVRENDLMQLIEKNHVDLRRSKNISINVISDLERKTLKTKNVRSMCTKRNLYDTTIYNTT